MAVKTAVASAAVVSTTMKPEVVVERERLYKQVVDLLLGLTGRTERFACLSLQRGDLCVRLADSEHAARKGA